MIVFFLVCISNINILTMPLLPEPKKNNFQNLILSCRAWNCCLDVRNKYKGWYKSSIKLTVTLVGWPQLKEVWGAGRSSPLLTSYLPIIICTTTPIAKLTSSNHNDVTNFHFLFDHYIRIFWETKFAWKAETQIHTRLKHTRVQQTWLPYPNHLFRGALLQ